MIKTSDLTKKFASFTAVDDLNLHVKRGEAFGFVGPNGAGKTTTIKMMVGILPSTKGKIEIAGFDIQKQPIKAKKTIGYIPDIPYVYPNMSGREFLYFVAKLYNIEAKKEKIDKLLNIFSLENLVDGYFKDYSRGTKQKITILSALLHQPKILIIDEPILGLDPAASQIAKNLLIKFKKNGGTIFVCSHTLSVIEQICDRIGIIDNGKMIFVGTLPELTKKLKTKKEQLENLYLKITNDSRS